MGLKTSADYAEMLNRHFSDDIGPGSVMEPRDVVKAAMIVLNDPAIDRETVHLDMPRTMDIFVVWAVSDESVKKAEAIRRRYKKRSAWITQKAGTGTFKRAYVVKASHQVANEIKAECAKTHFHELRRQGRDYLVTSSLIRRVKQCPQCKRAFLAYSVAKIYCSPSCSAKAAKERRDSRKDDER